MQDLSTEQGARQLARDLEAYWKARGSKKIKAWSERVYGGKRGQAFICYGTRSNMVDGLPPDWTPEMKV